jgi:hypothetical protein
MNQFPDSIGDSKAKHRQLLFWAISASILATLFMATTLGLLLLLSHSVSEGGLTKSARASRRTDVTIPERPPTPPLPDIYVSDLEPLRFESSWGVSGVDKTVIGNPLIVEGKTYERGLGTHANGQAIFEIPAGVHRFVAVVGLDDEVLDDEFARGSVCFEVYAWVHETSPVLLGKSPLLSPKTVCSWALDLKLDSRFKQIGLVVADAEDGNECDHADWVNAGFLK